MIFKCSILGIRRITGTFTLLATNLCLVLLVTPKATANPSALCDDAAYRASYQSGVPIEVLRTIARIETGRVGISGLEPWPWTVNMQGHGVWFNSVSQAKAYVFEHLKGGARSFDIGCFQINYRWHGHAFKSIDEMFDPVENSLYAAKFLLELNEETGSWVDAIGAYHSRTKELADRYVAQYKKISALPRIQRLMPLVSRGPSLPFKGDAKPFASHKIRTEDGSRKHRGSLFPLSDRLTPVFSLLKSEG